MDTMSHRLMTKEHCRCGKGFTLAELLVTVAIIAILGAFGTVAVVRHQRSLKRTEDDNIAREIYSAAQNNLTQMYADGTWKKRIRSESPDYWGASLDSLTTPDGTETAESHQFYRLVVNQGKEENGAAAWDDALLPEGSIDDTARDGGSYLIDYDRRSAQVYAVFYTDRTHGVFLQAGGGKLTSQDAAGLYDIVSKSSAEAQKGQEHYTSEDESLKDVCVGYYGGALAAAEDGTDSSDRTAIPTVSLNLVNGKKLYLTGTINWEKAAAKPQTFKVVVHGVASGNSKEVSTVTLNPAITSLDQIDQIVLDSVTESSRHFGNQCAGENPLILGEDVYCTLETEEGNVIATSNTENSLFATVTRTDANGSPTQVTVENGRQLENLSQEISGITTVTDAVLKNDIDWSDFAHDTIFGVYHDALNQEGRYIGIASDTLVAFDGGGHKISHLVIGTNDSRKSNTISNRNAGLFSRIGSVEKSTRDHFAVRDLCLDGPSLEVSQDMGSGGFVIGSDNAAKSFTVSLSDVTITSPRASVGANSNLGGLIGYVGRGEVSISDCRVDGKVSLQNTKDAANAGGSVAVGGLIGCVSAQEDSSVTIRRSSLKADSGSVLSSAAGSVGGLLGSFAVNEKNPTTSLLLDGCEVDGISELSGGQSAGALAGYLAAGSVSVTDCTVSDLSSVSAGQGSAGGFVGTVASSVHSYTQTDGSFQFQPASSYAVTAENGSAGGILGFVGASSFSMQPGTDGSLRGLSSVSITGTCAGGAVGSLQCSTGNLSQVTLAADHVVITGTEASGGILGSADCGEKGTLIFSGNTVQCGSLTAGSKTAGKTGGMIGEGKGNLTLRSLTLRVSSALAAADDSNGGVLSLLAMDKAGDAGGLAGALSGDSLTIDTVTINGGNQAESSVTGEKTAGGLVGSVTGTNQLKVNSAMVSCYVYQSGRETSCAAGGLIGMTDAGTLEITDSCVGGRTYQNVTSGEYYGNTDSHTKQGRFNVWSDGGSGSAAGGFLGAIQGKNLTIRNCYTTASVYSEDASSYAGGFLGVATDSAGMISNTYATGLVSSSSANKGTYAGVVNQNITGSNNDYLSGINVSLSALGTANARLQVMSVSTGKKFTEGDIVAAKRAKAVTFDTDLGSEYPLKTTAQLAGKKEGYHLGDWPIPSEIDIQKTFVVVDFEDENGQRLVSPLFVEQGKTADNRQSQKMSDAMNQLALDGCALDHWNLNGQSISENADIWSNPIEVSFAVQAVAWKNTDITFYIINPLTGQTQKIGTSAYQSENGAKLPDIPEFEGYEQDKWYLDAAGTSPANAVTENGYFRLSDGATAHAVYLTYKPGSVTYQVCVELRADSADTNYPLVYGRFVYEIKKGETKSISLPLPDSAALSGLTLSDEPLQKKKSEENGRIVLEDVTDSDAATLDHTNNHIQITGSEAVTYVVLYTGNKVAYTVNQVFENTSAGSSAENLTFSRGETRTVTTNGEEMVGSILDLGQFQTNYPGFTVSGPGSAFLDKDPAKNVFTITYTRNRHALIKDSGGVYAMKPILLYFGEPLWGTSDSAGYLTAEAAVLQQNAYKKTGYHLVDSAPWCNQADQTVISQDVVMPDQDLTVVANWQPNSNASYTVEIWQQKVDDTQKPGVSPQNKNDYDFYGTFTIAANDWYYAGIPNQAPSWIGDETAITTMVRENISKYDTDFQYFSLNMDNTTGFNQENGTTVTVKPDGSTVYGIYYDRKTITVTFVNDPDDPLNTDAQNLYYRSSSQETYEYWYNNNIYYIYYTRYSRINTSSGAKLAFPSKPEYIGNIGFITNEWLYDYIDTDGTMHYFSLSGSSYSNIDWVQNADTQQWELVQVNQGKRKFSYQGLYGQTLPQEAQNRFLNKIWREGRSGSQLTMLASYVPPDDNTEINLSYNGSKLKIGSKYQHFKENADGEVNASPDYTVYAGDNIGATFTFTDKYYGYDVYKYQLNGGRVRECEKNVSVYASDTLNIYHRRKTYDVYLENVAKPENITLGNANYQVDSNGNIIQIPRADNTSEIFGYDENYNKVRYEENLGNLQIPAALDVSFMPASIDKYGDTTGYKFGGWYKSADYSEDSKVTNWSDETMPAHSVQYFAYWIPPEYTVSYHIGDSNDVAFSESISKYGTISYRSNADIEADQKAASSVGSDRTLVSWYTDPSMDETSRYIPSTEVTSDLDLYGKFVPAEGSKIQVKVKYVKDLPEGGTEVLGEETLTLEVGKTYTLTFRDEPGAIPSGSATTITATGDMNLQTFEMHYIPDRKKTWTYTRQDVYKYTDMDSEKAITVTGSATTQTTDMDSKVLYGENKDGYTIDGYTKTAEQTNSNVNFVYSPDYVSRKRNTISVIYDGTSYLTQTDWTGKLFDTSGLVIPQGYRLETRISPTGTDQSFVDVGDYHFSWSLVLTNGTDNYTLYRNTATLRILKRPVLLASGDLTAVYDGSAHALEGVKSVWTTDETAGVETGFVGTDGDGITYSGFPTITEVGTVKNTFTCQLREGVNGNNYDIQYFYGTLKVTDRSDGS